MKGTTLYRRVSQPRRGQALVFIALTLLVLLGGLGLALDGGYNYAQRRTMQNAADAAAIAGANAVASKSINVLTAVKDAAAANGVDRNRVTCNYITDAYDRTTGSPTNGACQDNLSPPVDATNKPTTGVQVTVTEEHRTFVMVALGAPTSGTAATAAAQVQVLVDIPVGPFTVCGINTTTWLGNRAGPASNIYATSGTYPTNRLGPDGITYQNCGNAACKMTQNNADRSPIVEASAYYYNTRSETGFNANPSGPFGFVQPGAPTFLIHDPQVALCNITSNSFKGIRDAPNEVFKPSSAPIDYNQRLGLTGTPIDLDTGEQASVSTSVNGINGCRKNAPINKCVLFLPVVDASGPGGQGSNVTVGFRSMEAFYMEEYGNGANNATTHTGKLIKNYSIQGEGAVGWSPTSTAPRTIRLIR